MPGLGVRYIRPRDPLPRRAFGGAIGLYSKVRIFSETISFSESAAGTPGQSLDE